ncbi:MAG: hypothetical protein COV57_03180 [Candidatus Liptonbacteria bacterium CG11_big_fil_rev_8_21_14_0_20_35_14]|uniref:Metal-binding protein n=1 Tax=Candidatus Liptonbacteria bacterium CG11_big_fil_rev_8_21_14_0_20_35_14 TaxID=1974634 RepID=A0A2H0N6X4_9BACT|nr:MAG: hypothetical protein COV57_03180 [Candidatus Liptonbacteria bacterium CG11_big_fil_rev_8_21_14_0_20_35_14]
MKYRSSSKIKSKHGLIDGLLLFLKKIEVFDEISAINLGEIRPGRLNAHSGFKVKIQYKTKSGLKLIARGQGVQEVFIVSDKVDDLIKKLKSMPEVIKLI